MRRRIWNLPASGTSLIHASHPVPMSENFVPDMSMSPGRRMPACALEVVKVMGMAFEERRKSARRGVERERHRG